MITYLQMDASNHTVIAMVAVYHLAIASSIL